MREAIEAANVDETPDTIQFAASLGPINLTAAAGGQLSITNGVTIDASMLSNGITIHAATNSRIFNILGGNVALRNLTLTGGVADYGGGIRSEADSLTLENMILEDNQATHNGGGLWVSTQNITWPTQGPTTQIVQQVLLMQNCQVRGNTAAKCGGGIFIEAFVSNGHGQSADYGVEFKFNISDTTIDGNTVTGPIGNLGGGGLFMGLHQEQRHLALAA